MTSHPIFLLYGVVILALTSVAQYRGFSFTSVNQLNNVPKSIRDNPGAYRSHYGFYPRYIGGK